MHGKLLYDIYKSQPVLPRHQQVQDCKLSCRSVLQERPWELAQRKRSTELPLQLQSRKTSQSIERLA